MKSWLSIFSAVLAAGMALWWWNDAVHLAREKSAREAEAHLRLVAAWNRSAAILVANDDWRSDPRAAIRVRDNAQRLLEQAPPEVDTTELRTLIKDARAVVAAGQFAARVDAEARVMRWETDARRREKSILSLVNKITLSDARDKISQLSQLDGEIGQAELFLQSAPPTAKSDDLRQTVLRARTFSRKDR